MELIEVQDKNARVRLMVGQTKRFFVHREGATRAFGPGDPDLPPVFASIGQPVLVGGTMGTASASGNE